ncbi:PREDICTED: rasGAP-activating-like protein 1 [Thamnophis sirtalis]|uniref:RasGAP-activating-like protein 1 n=2 Tax=Thamnophis TaxID=34999 RepID=A0A6I9Z2P3_9SAUR|nr:PREDICTED: rasGAP-activating-like protein 1 [Thamnophis sirtalis]
MVYKQLLLHKDKLREKYQEISNTEATREQSNAAKKASDKNQRRLTAAAHLLEVIQGLEQAHKAFEHQEGGEKPGTGTLPPP